MAQLVTLQQAADHLGLTDVFGTSPATQRERDLQMKLDTAEAIVLDYLKGRDNWPNQDSPILQAAILLQCAELWRFRGDDPDGNSGPQTAGDLSPSVTNILRRWRDPALA